MCSSLNPRTKALWRLKPFPVLLKLLFRPPVFTHRRQGPWSLCKSSTAKSGRWHRSSRGCYGGLGTTVASAVRSLVETRYTRMATYHASEASEVSSSDLPDSQRDDAQQSRKAASSFYKIHITSWILWKRPCQGDVKGTGWVGLFKRHASPERVGLCWPFSQQMPCKNQLQYSFHLIEPSFPL